MLRDFRIMPKAKEKSKRRRLEDLEEENASQRQSRTRNRRAIEDENEEIEVQCTQTAATQASQSQKTLNKEDLNRRVVALVRYLLFADRKKYPIRRGDITKNVLKEHSKAFNEIMERAKSHLQKVFGIKVEEIGVGKTKAYILVNTDQNEAEHQLLDWGDDTPKLGLLMVVLSIIFMSDHQVTESLLWHTLRKLGIEPKTEHEVFGDPDKLISQEFVRQCYLDRQKITGGDETAYKYRWGPRAEKELTKRHVLSFVSKLYGTEMNAWTSQMKEILAEEAGQTVNGTQH